MVVFPILTKIVAQTSVLNVPLISQEASKWCWAASMEMIIKFNDPSSTATQCNFAQKYFRLDNPNCDCALMGCPSNTTTCTSTPSSCNRGMDLMVNYTTKYAKIFNLFGYYAIQVNTPMSFDEVKTQINSCMPFTLTVSGYNSGVSSSQVHVLVAKGYHSGNEKNWVIINDPLLDCRFTPSSCVHTGLVALRYPLVNRITGTTVNAFNESVHHIQKIGNPICPNCPSSNLSNKDLSYLNNKVETFLSTAEKKINAVQSVAQNLEQFKGNIIPIQYLPTTLNKNFKTSLSKNNTIYDLYSDEISSQHFYRFDKEDINLYTCTSISESPNKELISDLLNIPYSLTSYIVMIPDLPYRFYYKDGFIAALQEDITIGGTFFKKNKFVSFNYFIQSYSKLNNETANKSSKTISSKNKKVNKNNSLTKQKNY